MKVRKWDFPNDLCFDEHHQWVRFHDGIARVGLTDFGQESRGDVLYVQLPAIGTAVTLDEPVASIETGKWVGRIYSPCSGVIRAVNDALEGDPGTINADPYRTGWMFEVEEPADTSRVRLMQGESFRRWLEGEIERYLLEEDPSPEGG